MFSYLGRCSLTFLETETHGCFPEQKELIAKVGGRPQQSDLFSHTPTCVYICLLSLFKPHFVETPKEGNHSWRPVDDSVQMTRLYSTGKGLTVWKLMWRMRLLLRQRTLGLETTSLYAGILVCIIIGSVIGHVGGTYAPLFLFLCDYRVAWNRCHQ